MNPWRCFGIKSICPFFQFSVRRAVLGWVRYAHLIMFRCRASASANLPAALCPLELADYFCLRLEPWILLRITTFV